MFGFDTFFDFIFAIFILIFLVLCCLFEICYLSELRSRHKKDNKKVYKVKVKRCCKFNNDYEV